MSARSNATRKSNNARPAAADRDRASAQAPAAQPEVKQEQRQLISLDAIEDLRVMNEAGEITNPNRMPKLSREELLRVHRAMVLTRKLDIRMLAMQRQGEMGTFAPGLGQEATQIGQVFPLTKADWYAPSYRSFGAQLWRGWPIDQLMLLWDGFFEGFAPPADVNDLPFCIVIGSHVPTATGIAMGMKIRGASDCVLVNFGDGASSQGVVSEAFNFAAVYQSPVVFVLENNGWAISMRAETQVATESYAVRGVGFGIPSIRVDGNDVLAMITASREACERARAGNGPTLIEAVTYRMSVHTTADDPKVYRSENEVAAWEARCPIARFEKHLIGQKILSKDDCERIGRECEEQILAARESFRARASANPREVFDHIYAELPPELERQRAEYFRKLEAE
ncbi:MAG: pyruvate dehydrogenase (acetyl-transferring) E1 component subunit alpha [Phycisphaerales bacterium]